MSGLQLHDPQILYRRWEDSQWSPFEIDLRRDCEQWREMAGEQRELVHFVLSSLMVAEERITTKFAGLVAAHGFEEEATFLATQQVAEARHMQFYARFQDEVVAEPKAIAAHVERARAVDLHGRLLAAPDELAAKARFVALYHLILEGTLGRTSFKFVTDYLRAQELLGGFVEGYSKIHDDETRQIGYGVWFLREAVRSEPAAADVIRQTLRDLLPSVADTLKPPGGEDVLGVTPDEIRAFALAGLERRMKIIGVPLETIWPAVRPARRRAAAPRAGSRPSTTHWSRRASRPS